jgi:hypothetical protein
MRGLHVPLLMAPNIGFVVSRLNKALPHSAFVYVGLASRLTGD